MRLIGLTGGIGTGKSTVAHLLAARGAALIDADLLAREVVEPGTPALASPAPLVVVDVPLLLEGGDRRRGMFEGVLMVWAPPAVQLERLRARDGWSEEQARQRVAAQMPVDDKRGMATWVIDNSGSP